MTTEEQLKQKLDEMGTAFEAFKKANDAELKQLKEKGHADPLLKAQVDKANEDVGKLNTEITELKTALARRTSQSERDEKTAELHAQYKGVQGADFLFKGGDFSPEAEREYKKAFQHYIKTGEVSQILMQGKALTVGNDSQGGYLVRPEIGEMVQTKIFESSNFRKHMGQQSISSDALEFPTDGDEAAASWVGELASRSATSTPTVGMARIETHEIMASPKASQRFLDDASVNGEQWIGEKAADKFMRTENDSFANGTGIKKPRGFLTYASGTSYGQIEQIVSGHATLPTGDGLINLEAALKSAYKSNAVWFMARLTLAACRKLKDGQGNYLWQPGLQQGNPSLLLGHPVEESADMPALGASSLSIAFGNFKIGYKIVDRIGMRLLRDPFTAKPYVQFDYTKRVGGDVVVFEAIKLQVTSV